jgi:hypothetical protein
MEGKFFKEVRNFSQERGGQITSQGHHATSMGGLSGQIMSNLAENGWEKGTISFLNAPQNRSARSTRHTGRWPYR